VVVEKGNGELKDPFFGMPWFIKAVALIGVPSVISLLLVWSIQVKVSDTVYSNAQAIHEVRLEAIAHDVRVQTSFAEIKQQGQVNERLLRMICSSLAKTPELSQNCWR
jgi:hypothetical protein